MGVASKQPDCLRCSLVHDDQFNASAAATRKSATIALSHALADLGPLAKAKAAVPALFEASGDKAPVATATSIGVPSSCGVQARPLPKSHTGLPSSSGSVGVSCKNSCIVPASANRASKSARSCWSSQLWQRTSSSQERTKRSTAAGLATRWRAA